MKEKTPEVTPLYRRRFVNRQAPSPAASLDLFLSVWLILHLPCRSERLRPTQEETDMHTDSKPLEDVLVADKENWTDGPPHELFRKLRSECPVHWADKISDYPEEDGYWSLTTQDDIHAVSRDWETYSSERGGITGLSNVVMPLELQRAMFIAMDPPKHDRLKALFQTGFTPKRIAAHEDSIRKIVVDVLDRLEGRERCDLVTDVAQPAVSRVIGSFMGIPEEDDAAWAELMNTALAASDPAYTPDVESVEA